MAQKLSTSELREVLNLFCKQALTHSQLKIRQIILFGSYARGDADDESDIDIMILTDVPRAEISSVQTVLADITSQLGEWQYRVMVSPTMQNYAFFQEWRDHSPFYRNVTAEGVSLYAA